MSTRASGVGTGSRAAGVAQIGWALDRPWRAQEIGYRGGVGRGAILDCSRTLAVHYYPLLPYSAALLGSGWRESRRKHSFVLFILSPSAVG
jgi:hypothetical protein